jgi:tetratricopeptide (TPR) repeat protein
MYELKPLLKTAVPAALEKAKHYRLLNEAVEAESICLDIIEIEPDNQNALIVLLLAQTDQFEQELSTKFSAARDTLKRLQDDYNVAYYRGIICERRAKFHLHGSTPGSGHIAYDWFRQAMESYEKAMAVRPSGIDDAILRWNTCARILKSHPEVMPSSAGPGQEMLE